MIVPVVVMGSIALIGGVAYLVKQQEKKRTEAMQLAAQMMGFTFTALTDGADIGDFPLYRHGRSKKMRNAMEGTLGGRAAVIGDYSYYVQSGKSGHTVVQTVVLFKDAVAGMPDFSLSPESVFHRLAEVFGYQDIDFDTNEEFSKKYLLRGQDETAIRRLFTNDALTLLAGQPGWSVEAVGGRVLVYRGYKAAEAAQLPAFAADTLRIAGALSPRVPS